MPATFTPRRNPEGRPRAHPRGRRLSSCADSNQSHPCNPRRQFTRSPGISRSRTRREAASFKRCNHRNQQYSVIALTNGSGAIQERYAYDAYGGLDIYDATGTSRTTSAENNRYTYTGREYDEDLSLYHYRARMYDSASGRFCSRDPIGDEDGNNIYRVGFVPGKTDPSGKYTCPPTIFVQQMINLIHSIHLDAKCAIGVGIGDPFHEYYENNPFQHCVWNCRMTRTIGESAAESCSSQKEQVDMGICDYAKELDGHGCFTELTQDMQEQLAAYCCSADQESDYDDNASGRDCGPVWLCPRPPFYQSCERCCNRQGLDENTPEGPGTSRPCSDLLPEEWEDLIPNQAEVRVGPTTKFGHASKNRTSPIFAESGNVNSH